MTEEQMQRKMEFIVEQQAQFAVSIQWFEEHLKHLEEERIRDRPRLARLEQSYQTVVDLLRNYDSRMDTCDSRLNRVEAESDRLENALARFAENADSRLAGIESSLQVVAIAQVRTDEKLSALIDIVRQDRGKTQ